MEDEYTEFTQPIQPQPHGEDEAIDKDEERGGKTYAMINDKDVS